MTIRSKIAMVVAEFLGTAVLATAVINISRSQIGIGYFVAIGVGLTLGLLVLGMATTSGAHFNPAVTIGLWTIRKVGTLIALAYIAAQMLGGVVAWRLNEYFTGQTLSNIAGKSFEWRVLVAEAVGTFIFTFLIAAAVYQGFRGLKLAALVGGGLFIGTIVATVASNGMLNPAVALADQSWGRAYIFGPIIGAVVGMNLYAFLFAPESIWIRSASSRASKTGNAVVISSSTDTRTSTAKVVSKPKKVAKTTKTKTTAKKPARRTRK